MKKLLCILLLALTTPGSARPQPSSQVSLLEAELDQADPETLALRTDESLTALFKLAVWKLRLDGYDKEADIIEGGWAKYQGYLPFQITLQRDNPGVIGDYKPLSDWLAEAYKLLEETLGEDVCEFLHLDDINTLNFTIPVVFAMRDVLGPIEMEVDEYALHFNPFCGVVAYWLVWGGCTVATYGSGMFLICTPMGNLAERFVVKVVAPRYAPKAYEVFWE